jgi:hypothetical protein
MTGFKFKDAKSISKQFKGDIYAKSHSLSVTWKNCLNEAKFYEFITQ